MRFLLLFSTLFPFALSQTSDGCTIYTNQDLTTPQPLIVNLNYTIRLPKQADEVSFISNEAFYLSCPSGYLIVQTADGRLNLTETVPATCFSGKQFSIQNATTIFSNITCSREAFHIARLTNLTCEEDNQEIEVGFLVDNVFIRHLRICFDNKKHVSLYSQLEISFAIQGRQSNFPRPSWINDDFYNFGSNSSNKDANSLVTAVNQIATISKLIGYNDTSSNPYVNSTSDFYLARGHLTAKADVVFGSQQRLTFHMVNAAPQWQIFNGYNWAYFEEDARRLAINYNLSLQVYTGTYGVMSLPHVETNESVEIYLYTDDNGNLEFPVPLLFWKFLYDPTAKAGIVIVGVNNPYIQNVSEAIICKDVYESINWTTTFTRNDIRTGYMYGCAPDEFRKTVTYLPNVPVESLLLYNSTYSGTRPSSVGGILSISYMVALCVYIIVSYLT